MGSIPSGRVMKKKTIVNVGDLVSDGDGIGIVTARYDNETFDIYWLFYEPTAGDEGRFEYQLGFYLVKAWKENMLDAIGEVK